MSPTKGLRISADFGYVGAFGPSVDAIARAALESPNATALNIRPTRNPYHITLIPKHELRALGRIDPTSWSVPLLETTAQIIPLGIGGSRKGKKPVIFVIVVWNAAQQARKALGLPFKQLHITLTQDDNHDMDKGVDSLLPDCFPTNPSVELLDHLVFSLVLEQRVDRAQDFAIQLCRQYPQSPKGFVRLGDISFKKELWKLAMLSYGRVLHLSTGEDKLESFCLERMTKCTEYTEWGAVFLTEEVDQVPIILYPSLLEPWRVRARERLSDALGDDRPSLTLEPREQLYVPDTNIPKPKFIRLPRFFRWIVPFHFALMSTPRDAADIALLGSSLVGIRHVVTLTEETPLPDTFFQGTNVTHTHLPIPNMQPPSIEQVDLLLRLFEDETQLPILVHCGGGKGRAGTVAACYLAAYGFQRPPSARQVGETNDEPVMSASQAIAVLREIRPGSIETESQEQFVQRWCSVVWKRHAILPPIHPEPTACPPEIVGRINGTVDLIVLVGLPGSGKSSFGTAVMTRNDQWRRISTDESGPGGRSACESDIGRRGTARVILDRCNPTAAERKYWLSLAGNWATNPIAVYFDVPAELCISRAQQRPDHPTLPPGNRVVTAVHAMRKQLEPPTLGEGFVGIATVRSFEAAMEVMKKVAPAGIFKFPRTPHLINLGAASGDDIYTPMPLHDPSLRTFQSPNVVTITEKLDGANMGISLSSDRRITVQNRSHYVTSSSHEQFKKLDHWIEAHREGLYEVLDRDALFPERFILFGEWLAATHSIPYTHLPDLFVAFDVYDRRTRSYLLRSELDALLAKVDPPIHVVPVLWTGPESESPDEERLREMVRSQSLYYDGPVEGVYLKVENTRENKLVSRSKVVRGDFIAGNEHWTKGPIRWNSIQPASDQG